MTFKRLNMTTVPLALAALLLASGCKSNSPQATTPPQQAQPAQPAQNAPAQQAMNPEAAPPQQAAPVQQAPPQQAPLQQAPPPAPVSQAYAPAPAPRASVIPAGSHITVTLRQTLSSKTSQPGDSFSATVAAPVTVHGATLIRAGSSASGTVLDSKGQGRFKGEGMLSIRLDTIRSGGRTYQVASSTVDRVEKGKGKRTAVLTGGGGGLGALIGGLAGGGKGALIGGLAGAGAGGAGSAFTGNKAVVIPAETRLTFRLERDVTLN